MKRVAWGHLGVALALACLVAGESAAQPRGMLALKLSQPDTRPRMGGPLTVDVTFDWRGSGLLQGRLVFDFGEFAGARRFESGEFALANGQQTFRLLLPPIESPADDKLIEVNVFFRGAQGAMGLGRFPLFLPSGFSRTFSVAVIEPPSMRDRSFSALARGLRADTLIRQDSSGSGIASTGLVRMAPEEAPVSPFGWCSFDAVLLEGEGFAETRERPLKALLKWVEAGGSVCVAPAITQRSQGKPPGEFKPYHAEFLNALAAAGAAGRFTLMPTGHLVDDAGGGGDLLAFQPGLGHAIILLGPLTERDFNRTDVRQALCGLYKVRREAAAEIVRGRPLSFREDRYASRERGGESLEDWLRPHSAQLVPFSLIVFVLVALVVVVGPVDYFVLGFLRVRRLTWVFFPVVAVGATVFMVLASEHYLGKNEGRRSMTFVDVGENGRVLRAVRCEYYFPSRNGDIATEVEDAFFSAGAASGGRRWRGSTADAATLCPIYEGRYPIRYAARQSVRKWSPFMNWNLRFDFPQADNSIRWEAVDRATLVGALQHVGSDSDKDDWRGVTAPSPSKREAMTALKEKLVGPGPFAGDILVVTRRGFAEAYRASEPTGARVVVGPRPFQVLYLLSVTPQSAPRVFAFRSPCAAVDDESLALLDDSDPSFAAVIVVVPRGEDYVVYRRRYPTGT